MNKDSSIKCPSCETVYSVSDANFGRGGRVVRCSICNHSFAVRPAVPSVVPDTKSLVIDDEPFETASAVDDIPFEKQPLKDKTVPRSEDIFAEDDESASEESADLFESEELVVDSPDEATGFSTESEDELSEVPGEGIEVGDYKEPETKSEDIISEREELLVGESDDTAIFDSVETGELPVEAVTPAETGSVSDQSANDTPDTGVVEFFVEDEAGEINRIETHAIDEPRGITDSEESIPFEEEQTVQSACALDIELPDDVMKHPPAPDAAVPQPQPPDKVAAETVMTDSKASAQSPRWRDPGKGTKRRTLLESEADAAPSSGILYHFVLMFIGAGALTTNFVNFDIWRFDPVWSCTIILLAVMGFFMQNLSGLYIAGFFSLFYAFALFSTQRDLLERSEFLGVMHLGIIISLAFLFLVVYYVLTSRKRGHFVLKEGSGQSYVALFIGLGAALVAFWAHMDSNSVAPLGKWLINGYPINDFTYYAGVNLAIVFQATLLSLAIAFGISARRVRNRILLLAALGAFLGFLALLLLYAPLVVGEISFFIPV